MALTDRESRPVARQRQIGGRSHYQTEHVADEVSPEAVGDAGSGIGDPGKCRRPGGLSRRRRGILDPDGKAAGLPTAHQAVDDVDQSRGGRDRVPSRVDREEDEAAAQAFGLQGIGQPCRFRSLAALWQHLADPPRLVFGGIGNIQPRLMWALREEHHRCPFVCAVLRLITVRERHSWLPRDDDGRLSRSCPRS